MNRKLITRLTDNQLKQHRQLWNDNDRFGLLALARRISKPALTEQQLDHGWQWLTLLSNDYEQAANDFIMLVNRTY